MIEEVLTLLSYFSILAFLNYINYKQFKILLNPIFLLSVPFTLIVICCLLFNQYIDFIPFHIESLWSWIFGLCIFYLGGITASLLVGEFGSHRSFKFKTLYSNKTQFFITISILSLFIAFMRFRSLDINTEFGSKEMGEEMGTGGIIGRVSNIILMGIPFFVVYKIPKSLKFIIISMLLLMTISLGSKTWMTYALIASYIIYALNKRTINYRSIVLILCLLLLSFSLYYKLNTSIDDFDKFFGFVGRHLYFYITSGVLPLGEIYSEYNNIHSEEIVFPFVRLLIIWFGGSGVFHSSNEVVTDLLLGTKSNVFTFFGSLLLSKNLFDFIFYSFISGFVAYLIFKLFLISKNNIFASIAWGYTGAILFFGWYNWGFGFLRIWEIYAYSILFSVISKHFYIRNHKYKRSQITSFP